MKNSLVILLALCLASFASEAREVKGKVTSEKKNLSRVIVTDGQNFTQTRRNGTFRFEICDSAEFVYFFRKHNKKESMIKKRVQL